ncbi:hypothetical protein [Leptospira ilyithenensis]|uniref:SRPBCC family protein n=1 Tax=Leptospira ilyithenensis TaxID=2484901 RepID=A0A4R9LR90_9LEPT|nr:hypothetical protein [Leptospira ilyithenensis]TGN13201.1 hypothetical protein EHS11_04715 [Leptospira ilyithenensis]
MIVNVSTELKSDFETVKRSVLLPKLLIYVTTPLIKFTPLDPNYFPMIWKDGEYLVSMKLFGIIPFGKQYIGIQRFHDTTDEFILRDNGHGELIRKWDHWIFVRRTKNENLISYTDRIEIKAGLLTPLIWIFGNIFYRWRQHRWRKLISKGLDTL